MSEFTDLLRNTLKGVNDAYEGAVNDLRALVFDISSAAKEFSPEITVGLKQIASETSGSTFELNVAAGSFTREIAKFRVPATGYPIRQIVITENKSFATRKELENFFRELLSNPTSPLVSTLAFYMRVKPK